MTELPLAADEFYRSVAAYMDAIDPVWEEDRWRSGLAAERALLRAALGTPIGRTVLDCSCGTGGQAIPLAQLGWRVSATDLVASALATTAERARREGVTITTRPGDMRNLGASDCAQSDVVISCMALDNISEDGEIARAISGTFAARKSGGRCYLRLRDFDHLLASQPRYEVKEERIVPHGRVIRLEDWTFEETGHAICTYIFLREDERQVGYPWPTSVFAYRRRALRKEELTDFLRGAGFGPITFLPQRSPWVPYEVIAEKPFLWGER